MVNILDRSRRIRQVSGQLMPETTIRTKILKIYFQSMIIVKQGYQRM